MKTIDIIYICVKRPERSYKLKNLNPDYLEDFYGKIEKSPYIICLDESAWIENDILYDAIMKEYDDQE
jgi:hypothetical protein